MKYSEYIERLLAYVAQTPEDPWHGTLSTYDWTGYEEKLRARSDALDKKEVWPKSVWVDIETAAIFIAHGFLQDLPIDETYLAKRTFKVLWNSIRYGVEGRHIEIRDAMPSPNGLLPIVNLYSTVEFIQNASHWRPSPLQSKVLRELTGDPFNGASNVGAVRMRRILEYYRVMPALRLTPKALELAFEQDRSNPEYLDRSACGKYLKELLRRGLLAQTGREYHLPE